MIIPQQDYCSSRQSSKILSQCFVYEPELESILMIVEAIKLRKNNNGKEIEDSSL